MTSRSRSDNFHAAQQKVTVQDVAIQEAPSHRPAMEAAIAASNKGKTRYVEVHTDESEFEEMHLIDDDDEMVSLSFRNCKRAES